MSQKRLTQKEIWKDVKNYEGLYQVSNYGRVKSLNFDRIKKEKIMKSYVDKIGYYSIRLCKNGKSKLVRVHRLVAESFLQRPNKNTEVNHIDGNKLNNFVDNLEWVTHKENMIHAFKNNLAQYPPPRYGKANAKSKSVVQYDKNGNKIKIWECTKQAGEILKFNYKHISDVCLGKRKTAGGYIWKYELEGIE